jgi:glutaminase
MWIPNIFGIALITVDGQVYTKGDITSMVSYPKCIKSIHDGPSAGRTGPKAVQDKIGVDATGMRFNSIVAVELQRGKEINPLVNPGAIASSSLINGADSAAKWKSIVDIQSQFAGRPLSLNMPVYISEAGDNLRNQAIAHLLFAYGRMYFDPVQVYRHLYKTMRMNVNAKDLAEMACNSLQTVV